MDQSFFDWSIKHLAACVKNLSRNAKRPLFGMFKVCAKVVRSLITDNLKLIVFILQSKINTFIFFYNTVNSHSVSHWVLKIDPRGVTGMFQIIIQLKNPNYLSFVLHYQCCKLSLSISWGIKSWPIYVVTGMSRLGSW